MISFYKKFLKPLFFSRRFYLLLVSIIFLFIISNWFSFLFPVAEILLIFLTGLLLLDYLVLFAGKKTMEAERIVPARFSNGDENKVGIVLTNHYPFPVLASIIDEVPIQFQKRDFK